MSETLLTLVCIAGYTYSGSALPAFLLGVRPPMASTREIRGPARHCGCFFDRAGLTGGRETARLT